MVQDSARRVLVLLLAATLVCTAVPAQAPGQAPAPQKASLTDVPRPLAPKKDQNIRVDVDLVLINVTVTDPYNRLVTGLERENFRRIQLAELQRLFHVFRSQPRTLFALFQVSCPQTPVANHGAPLHGYVFQLPIASETDGIPQIGSQGDLHPFVFR